jgi:phage terminase large subunit-like protein
MPEMTENERLAAQLALLRGAEVNRMSLFDPYTKQREFFSLGATKRQRMFSAGNRLGKSDSGAYEMACHLTGLYPPWWQGRRYTRPVQAWACGLSAEATMKISQGKLCGNPAIAGSLGTGLIPKDLIYSTTLGRGVSGAYASITVKHKSGGFSVCSFKSYEQGWQKFQGDKIDVIWMDEEPEDYRVYTESRTRTVDTGGIVFITFTALNGETELFTSFANGKDPNKGYVNMTGDEVLAEPDNHFMDLAQAEGFPRTQEGAQAWYEKEVLSWPAHQRETRRSGAPAHGSGAVFTFLKDSISYTGRKSESGFVRMGWGTDFGGMGQTTGNFSHPFGAVLGLYDAVTDTIYVEHALRLTGGQVLEHAFSMKQICAAAPVFWPHDGARQASKDDPETTAGLYRKQGLRMWHEHATFASGGYKTEAGIMEMHTRFSTGRLKIHEALAEVWEEYRNYHRDEDGDIVRNKDDLMSAIRILVMMLPRFGVSVPMGNLSGRSWKDGVRDASAPARNHSDWDPITGRPY